MQTKPTIERKMADWMAAFNLKSNKQSQEAKILRDLTQGLKEKMTKEGMAVIPEMA